ncbi:MAG: twin-arginine translocase subunit TatC [Bdellovibrionaceae bacterium]|nr:twin-arginine translocase subunit TatC [Pseudobdellovibrionaceae bacterium]MBX3033613.1 twin-arginine translocase subunit TatC [Pseudobdellovibrionaceae bacterium]
MSDQNLSLIDHLTELRVRLVRSLGIILIATFVCFHYAEWIFNILREPIAPYLPQGGLIYTGPIDKFMAYVKIAVVAGVILSCPLWLWQVWQFVAPGLYKREKKYAVGFIFSGSGLFLLGVFFAYKVVLPMAFHFLMTFGGETDKPMIAIDSYLSFVTQITLMFGLSFELPLILVILAMMDLVSRSFLAKNRRYAVMIMAVVSAIVTPPDLLSMVMMLGPMWLLFEFGLILVAIVERKKVAATQSQRE